MEARRRHAAGAIDDAELRATEDAAIAEVVTMQRRLFLTAVTDGEFRREDVRSAVTDTVGGFRRTDAVDKHGRAQWVVDGELKVGGQGLGVAEQTAFVASQTVIAAKATLPSPAFLAATCYDPAVTGAVYGSPVELGRALAGIIRAEIELLVSRGVRYIQLNNPRYATYLFARGGQALTLEEAIAVDSLAVELDSRPEEVRIGLCPTHQAADTVDKAAAERLFAELPVDRWLLPYLTGSENELDLLRAVPADRDACLGVVDPAKAELEDIDTVMERMDRAAELKDIDDLALSPNAGFSDVAGRAAVGYEDQRRKLVLVETLARMCWGNEL
nr:hypothetical protein [Planomonospora venezuelensis]